MNIEGIGLNQMKKVIRQNAWKDKYFHLSEIYIFGGYVHLKTSAARAMKVLWKLGCCLQIEVGIVRVD